MEGRKGNGAQRAVGDEYHGIDPLYDQFKLQGFYYQVIEPLGFGKVVPSGTPLQARPKPVDILKRAVALIRIENFLSPERVAEDKVQTMGENERIDDG